MSGDVISGRQCGKITGIYLQQPRMTLQTDNCEQWPDCHDCPESKHRPEHHESISSLTSAALEPYELFCVNLPVTKHRLMESKLLATFEISKKKIFPAVRRSDLYFPLRHFYRLVSESCIIVKTDSKSFVFDQPNNPGVALKQACSSWHKAETWCRSGTSSDLMKK